MLCYVAHLWSDVALGRLEVNAWLIHAPAGGGAASVRPLEAHNTAQPRVVHISQRLAIILTGFHMSSYRFWLRKPKPAAGSPDKSRTRALVPL
jgi:hypothetical protein